MYKDYSLSKDHYAYFEVPYHGKDHNDYVNGAGFCCEGKDKKLQAYGGGIGKGNEEYEKMQYYYHADHLGSSSYITNLDAQIVQHVEYVPFGEVFIEERNQSWNTPYLFNGKELDEETGLYYYGARYYNPRESVWLSVDPMAEKYPNVSPYAYTFQNPVKLIDPNGEEPTPSEAARMAAHVYGGYSDSYLTGGWKVSSADFGVEYVNEKSHFISQLYERTINGVTEYAYVTAGTEFTNGKDWLANAKQIIGTSEQYEDSVNNARSLSREIKNGELTFVGHSKGGGEAALNAMATGRKAITFNAAGVSIATKKEYLGRKSIFKSYKDIIDAYIMTTDPLNGVQNMANLLPSVDGTRYYVTPASRNGYVNGHSIDNMVDALERYKLTPKQQRASDEAKQRFNPNIKW